MRSYILTSYAGRGSPRERVDGYGRERVEGHGSAWKAVEARGRPWKATEARGSAWKAVEGDGYILRRPRKPSPPSSPWYEHEMRALGGSAR